MRKGRTTHGGPSGPSGPPGTRARHACEHCGNPDVPSDHSCAFLRGLRRVSRGGGEKPAGEGGGGGSGAVVARPDQRPKCGGDGYHDGPGHYEQDCQEKNEDESKGEGEGTAVGKGQGVGSNRLAGRAAPVASGCSALPPAALPPPHHAVQERVPEIEDESGSGEDGGSEDGVGDESRSDTSESESDTSEDEGELPGAADASAARKRDLRPRPRTAAAPHGAGSGAGGDESEVWCSPCARRGVTRCAPPDVAKGPSCPWTPLTPRRTTAAYTTLGHQGACMGRRTNSKWILCWRRLGLWLPLLVPTVASKSQGVPPPEVFITARYPAGLARAVELDAPHLTPRPGGNGVLWQSACVVTGRWQASLARTVRVGCEGSRG
jgi:hypothetical protein